MLLLSPQCSAAACSSRCAADMHSFSITKADDFSHWQILWGTKRGHGPRRLVGGGWVGAQKGSGVEWMGRGGEGEGPILFRAHAEVFA